MVMRKWQTGSPGKSGRYEVKTADGGQLVCWRKDRGWWEYGRHASLAVRREVRGVTHWRPVERTANE